ncbi:hypothetical protein JCM10212_004273 [Sporobolomyces blumeae]
MLETHPASSSDDSETGTPDLGQAKEVLELIKQRVDAFLRGILSSRRTQPYKRWMVKLVEKRETENDWYQVPRGDEDVRTRTLNNKRLVQAGWTSRIKVVVEAQAFHGHVSLVDSTSAFGRFEHEGVPVLLDLEGKRRVEYPEFRVSSPTRDEGESLDFALFRFRSSLTLPGWRLSNETSDGELAMYLDEWAQLEAPYYDAVSGRSIRSRFKWHWATTLPTGEPGPDDQYRDFLRPVPFDRDPNKSSNLFSSPCYIEVEFRDGPVRGRRPQAPA